MEIFDKPQCLPRYTDDEVKVFHPVLGYCLNKAIDNLGTKHECANDLYIKHHKEINALTVDFAVMRSSTNKIVLPIEVKRTPASVSSIRYRNQARIYVTEAGRLAEKKFYALTNLEITELYRHHSTRPSVIEQMIKPGTIRSGEFKSTNVDEFLSNLISVLEKVLLIVLKDNYEYNDSIVIFSKMLSEQKEKNWHASLMPGLFEYIRGALKNSNTPASRWHCADKFKNFPLKMLDFGREYNFYNIFCEPAPSSKYNEIWKYSLINELYNAGFSKKTGDDIVELSHLIISKGREAEGLVATDIELARLVTVLAKLLYNKKLQADDIICDPAAGTGTLLINFLDFYTDLIPQQIWANDKESLYQESLSLRLGLLFPTVLANDNSPIITTKCISNLKPEQFSKVKIIVMNPPFISAARGKDVTKEKTIIAKRIRELIGNDSTLNIGQMGFEGPFIELVTSLAKDDTVMVFVVPKRYLTAQGIESQLFRRFLLEKFCLKFIVNYPKQGLFENVMKATMVIAGIKSKHSLSVKGLSVDIPIEQMDLEELFNQLVENMDEDSKEIVSGVTQTKITVKELQDSISKGWRVFFGCGKVVKKWIYDNLKDMQVLKDLKWTIKRGRLGNKGISDLLFISSNRKLWDILKYEIPKDWLKIGVKNSNQSRNLFLKDLKDCYDFLCPPESMSEKEAKMEKYLENIIRIYQSIVTKRKGKQKKLEKTTSDIRNILLSSRRLISPKNTILIPRNIRRTASIFVLKDKAYVSTNFIEINISPEEDSLLLLAWFLSIFGQLMFEFLAQDQEGTRKLEKEQIRNILIPNFNNISEQLKSRMIKDTFNSEFLDLYKIILRPIDLLWADILFGSKATIRLHEVKNLLEELIIERAPLSL